MSLQVTILFASQAVRAVHLSDLLSHGADMKLSLLATLFLFIPGLASAASLSPLDPASDLSAPLVVTQNEPMTTLHTARSEPKTDREFVDGEIFKGNPLGGLLVQDQWANPKAAAADNYLRRR